MKLPSLFPDASLLEQVEGIERGLRQRKRLSTLGWVGSVVFGAFEILALLLKSDWLQAWKSLDWRQLAAQWPLLVPLLLLVLSTLVFLWTRFWLNESEAPFRYTYSIGAFTSAPESPVETKLSWLRHDLLERLSQRIGRLSLLDDKQAKAGDSHIHISGYYVIRRRPPREIWMIEVTPWIRIGPADSSESLAHPVKFRLQASEPDAQAAAGEPPKLTPKEYEQILERVYFSVATQIYIQIRKDVENKIRLLPTDRFRAIAYFHEAEDYARSNTLDAYEEARELYAASLKLRLHTPCWRPPTHIRWRRRAQSLRMGLANFSQRVRRLGAYVSPRLGQVDVMIARAEIGYANMLLYRRSLAGLSGHRLNPVYEARPVAQSAVARLEGLTEDVPGQKEGRFDAHVTLALAQSRLGETQSAEESLERAARLTPSRASVDPRYLFVAGVTEIEPSSALSSLRTAVELEPEFELAQFELAQESDKLWRKERTFERNVAAMVSKEYEHVVKFNPGNVSAWARQGHMSWLLGEPRDRAQAQACFESGREYKEIQRETFVAELDCGLARIAAERGDFASAYEYYSEAVAALFAQGVSHAPNGYTSFDYFNISDTILKRYRQHKETVAELWSFLADKGNLESYFDETVAKLSTESGREQAKNGLAQVFTWVSTLLSQSEKNRFSNWIENGDFKSLAHRLESSSPEQVFNDLSAALKNPEFAILLKRYLGQAAAGRVRSAVYAFVLNDYGDACYNYYLRLGSTTELQEAESMYTRAIELHPTYVIPYYSLSRLKRFQGKLDEALEMTKKVNEFEPKWPDGQLAMAEAYVDVAQASKRDAAQRREDEAATNHQATEKQNQAKQKRQEQVEARRREALKTITDAPPGSRPGLTAPPQPAQSSAARNLNLLETAGGGPSAADQLEREAAALERDAQKLSNQAKELEGKAVELEQKVTECIREAQRFPKALLPQQWLWTSGGAEPAFNWSVIDHREFDEELKWEKELDELHVLALFTWGKIFAFQAGKDAPGPAAGTPPLAMKLFLHLQKHCWPNTFDLLRSCRELSTGVARTSYNERIKALVQEWRATDPNAYWSLTWATDEAFSEAEQDDILFEALKNPVLSCFIHLWIGDQLSARVPADGNKDRPELSKGASEAYQWAMEKASMLDDPVFLDDLAGRAVDLADRESVPESFWIGILKTYRRVIEIRSRLHQADRKHDYHFRIARVLLALSRPGEAISELEAGGALTAPERPWRRTAVQSVLKYVSSRETYQALKAWLEVQQKGAIRAGDRKAAEDAQTAALLLVREKYQAILRGPAAKPPSHGITVVPRSLLIVLARDLITADMQEGKHPLFVEYLPEFRERVQKDTGVPIPAVPVQWNTQFSPGSFQIYLREVPLAMSETVKDHHFCPESDAALAACGITPKTPKRSFRGNGSWLDEGETVKAREAALPVFNVYQYVVRELEAATRKQIGMLLGVEEVGEILDYPIPAEDRVRVTRLVRALAEEGVPLIDTESLREAIQAAGSEGSFFEQLAVVRKRLRPVLRGNQQDWKHTRLAPDFEAQLAGRMLPGGSRRVLRLDPVLLFDIQSSIRELGPKTAVVVGKPELRPYLRSIAPDEAADVPVLAREELIAPLDLEYDGFPAIEHDDDDAHR